MVMTPTRADLIALYGWCPECHAPRNRHMINTIDETGRRLTRSTLICTAHPFDHYPDKDILTSAELNALLAIPGTRPGDNLWR